MKLITATKLTTNLALSELQQTEHEVRDIYGGKGYGLCVLHCLYSAYVPPTYAISRLHHPINTEADIYVDNLVHRQGDYHFSWAVRSSGRVSMPGMMDTKLDVPNTAEDLKAAIRQVWDSWNNDAAKAYRAKNNIPDNEGTAVIVQHYVKPWIAGVMFTANPQDPLGKGTFDPSISFVVNQAGDQLVGGEVTPYEASLTTLSARNHTVFSTLYKLARGLFDSLGDSDIEFVAHLDWPEKAKVLPEGNTVEDLQNWASLVGGVGVSVHLLQWRRLNFAKKVFLPVSGRGDVIAYGRSIGAKGAVVAKICTPLRFSPNSILHVNDFKPEYYDLYTKSSGILAATGGFHCHAGIVARELGIPAVSGIAYDQLAARGVTVINEREVYLDGEDGAIFEIEDREKLSVREAAPIVSDVFPVQKRVMYGELFSHLSEDAPCLQPSLLAARFYYALDQHDRGLIPLELRDKVVNELALILNTYVCTACLGESRHSGKSGARWVSTIESTRHASKQDRAHIYRWLLANAQKRQIKDLEETSAEVCLNDYLGEVKTYPTELLKGTLSMLGYLNLFQMPNSNLLTDANGRDAVFLKTPTLTNAQLRILLRDLFYVFSGAWTSSYGGKKWRDIVEFSQKFADGSVPPIFYIDHLLNMEHNGGTVFGKVSTFMDVAYNVKQLLNLRRGENSFSQVLEPIRLVFGDAVLRYGVSQNGYSWYPVINLEQTFLPPHLWSELSKSAPLSKKTIVYEDKIGEILSHIEKPNEQTSKASVSK